MLHFVDGPCALVSQPADHRDQSSCPAAGRWRCDGSAVRRDQAGCGRSELHHQTHEEQEPLQPGETRQEDVTAGGVAKSLIGQV